MVESTETVFVIARLKLVVLVEITGTIFPMLFGGKLTVVVDRATISFIGDFTIEDVVTEESETV